VAICSIGVASSTSGQTPPAGSLQSLAGDWTYVINPPAKLELHLRTDAWVAVKSAKGMRSATGRAPVRSHL
jgi:hypothetical protein